MHPTPEGQKKAWTTPKITSTELSGKPFADLIDILHSALEVAERTAALNPNDRAAADLKISLQRMSETMESKAPKSAA